MFLGHCFACNNFGHKSLNCRTKRKVSKYKNKSSSNKSKGNKNIFTLQKYDIECYKCNNDGHMARYCKLKSPTKKYCCNQISEYQTRKILERKGRKGNIHDFLMCNQKPKIMALRQWLFKTYDW